MTHYLAPITGIGTEENPRRPDVPDGITWACVEDRGTHMVIATDAELDLPLA